MRFNLSASSFPVSIIVNDYYIAKFSLYIYVFHCFLGSFVACILCLRLFFCTSAFPLVFLVGSSTPKVSPAVFFFIDLIMSLYNGPVPRFIHTWFNLLFSLHWWSSCCCRALLIWMSLCFSLCLLFLYCWWVVSESNVPGRSFAIFRSAFYISENSTVFYIQFELVKYYDLTYSLPFSFVLCR